MDLRFVLFNIVLLQHLQTYLLLFNQALYIMDFNKMHYLIKFACIVFWGRSTQYSCTYYEGLLELWVLYSYSCIQILGILYEYLRIFFILMPHKSFISYFCHAITIIIILCTHTHAVVLGLSF